MTLTKQERDALVELLGSATFDLVVPGETPRGQAKVLLAVLEKVKIAPVTTKK